ncbi:sulfurtransferase [Polaribacter sp. R77954]|uniref:sulfurtransferase n=1 Tax=Polaribacter sp. R77954 TaxID=3093870 RepID=UPI0037C6CCEE
MALKTLNPIVSADWLYKHLNDESLIILDATLPKVTSKNDVKVDEKIRIKNAVFFDIKNVFSDTNAPFPNTVLSAIEFEKKAQDLGIQTNSCIVVYDDLGIYSSPRVWWLFQLMGFTNIAVLDGGLPGWKSKGYPIEKPKEIEMIAGNFIANYQANKIKYTNDVLSAIDNQSIIIADARSKGRFNTTVPEPRADVKGGHIPKSVSLPYSDIVVDGKLKSKQELQAVFSKLNPKKKDFIFSCGTGITASVLALGAEIAGFKNNAVYDGSWTEWGTTKGLPIEK